MTKGGKLMSSQIPFDPRFADECTYTVEEDCAVSEELGIEISIVYLKAWWNDEPSEGGEQILEKAFMYWTKGEENHKEYKEYYKWLTKEAKKRAFKCL